MARQVLPWVGMAVGAMVGAPQIGFMVGSLIGNAIDPQVINGPKLGEGQNNTASEGGYRPIVLGKGAVGVCMIHEGPLRKRTIRHRQSKGGGPVTTEERAYRTMAFALGESAYPDTGVQLLRLWIDGKLRYDVTPDSQIVEESEEFAEQFTFYPGTNDQLPDPDIEAFLGAGNVPSYRGGSPYIVFPNYDVTSSQGRAPMIKAELASDSIGMKAYANAHDSGVIYVSQNPLDWDGQTVAPILNTRVLYAGGGALTLISDSQAKVSFDEINYTDLVGLPLGSIGQGLAGLYCEDSRTWVVRARGYSGSGDPLLYKSSDGINYSPCSGVNDPDKYASAPCASLGSIVIFSASNTGYWRSSDGGNSFVRHGGFWTGISAINALVSTNSGFVAVLTNGEAYKSPNGLSPWVKVADGLPFDVGGIAYDPDNQIVMLAADGGYCAWSGSDGAGSWQSGASHGVAKVSFGNGSNNLIWHNGYFLLAGTSNSDGIIRASAHPDDAWQTVKEPINGGAIRGLVVAKGYVLAEKLPLSSVVDFCHDRVDLPSSARDTSQLDDMVEGIVFADAYSAADAIRTLMALYFFDVGEFDAGSGYKLNYVKRGGPAVVTLDEDDIVDGPDDWEREDSYERPRVLHLAYQNPVADYGAPNIAIKRTSPDVKVVGERSVNVPVVFSDVDEITQRADIMMTVVYTEIAGTYEISLPDTWLELAPTTCIGFSIRGKTRRLRMTDWKYSAGVIRSEWMADRQSSYTSNVTGLPVPPTTPPPPSIVGPTVSAVLDIPALVDSGDSLHLLVAASGQTEGWWGSVHQIKPPSEVDFSTAAVFNGLTTIMGVLLDDVTAANPHYTDTTNVIRVRLYSDEELQTHTQQQFLSENGAIALAWDDSDARHWEILQYRDAVKVGDKDWELSTLQRGRLNTASAEHPAGSLFVFLDVGLRAIPAQAAWLGEAIQHRAVSNGQSPDAATTYSEVYEGESQREFPVAHLFGEIAGDDLMLSCVPRHRFGTEDHPVQSINHDGYAWAATDGSNSADATTSDPSHTFDVSGWSTPITVTVAQINRITGAGPTVSESIE